MGPIGTFQLSEVLAPEPQSVGRARRLIAGAMAASGDEDLADLATLLVSEVVTNSILHAGTEIRLRYRRGRTAARIEVFDRSPLLPRIRNYDAEATTGRGLALVSALATSWGIRCEEGGKTLWFDLADGDGRQEAPSSTEVPVESWPSADPTFTVQLRDASPPLVRATIEHGDALLRELALLALGGELDDALPQGWRLPEIDVSPILAAAEAASAAGRSRADLEFSLLAGAHIAGIERLRMVDRADALARDDRLLAAPALPEVAVCRHWIYTQIAEQAAGHPPQAWELPEPLEPARVAARLAAEEVEWLERATAPTVVADDANRIIFVNEAVGELLGWPPGALVGQRLTVLIPPELREAHLAAFSRVQVTGEPRMLGSTVHVPALRRDGSTLDVALTIDRVTSGRRTAFRAVLLPAAEGSQGQR